MGTSENHIRISKFKFVVEIGEPAGIRTQDTRLKRAVLYQLSYRPAHAVLFKEAYISKELRPRQ
jgi:hypothetical protein